LGRPVCSISQPATGGKAPFRAFPFGRGEVNVLNLQEGGIFPGKLGLFAFGIFPEKEAFLLKIAKQLAVVIQNFHSPLCRRRRVVR
jgi:hypothetical protein